MALWTPYVEALDLSRTAVKQELPAPIDLTENPRLHNSTSPTNCGYSGHQSQDAWQYTYQRSLPPLSPPLSPELYDIESLIEDKEYQEFERDALRAMAEKNGGCLLGNNPRMRRAVQTSQAADDSYRKQRERNNFAAKQSRDRRKLREVRLAFQVTFLKKKLVALKSQLADRFCARCKEP